MQLRFLLFFLFSIALSQNQAVNFQLKGKVKTVESTTYLVLDDTQTTASGFLDSEYFDAVKLDFDHQGNLVLRQNYLDYQGKLGLFDKTIYWYNPENQLEKTETTLVQNGEEPTRISQTKNYYYLANKLVRADEFNFGRTTNQTWIINYKYFHQNLSEKEFWMEDEIFSKEIHTYDLTNYIESIQTFHNDGKIGQIIFFQYAEKRNLKNKITETGNEKIVESFEYENGLLKTLILKDSKDEIQMRKTYYPSGLPATIEKKDYNQNRLLKYDFKFTFDSQNNWINCLILEDEKQKFRIVRKINYH